MILFPILTEIPFLFFSQRAASVAGRQTGYPHQSKAWADTYLKQFRMLTVSNAAVSDWVQEHVLRDPTHAWLIPSLQPKGVLIDLTNAAAVTNFFRHVQAVMLTITYQRKVFS